DQKARDVAARSKQMALAFGLPSVLTVSKPIQPAKGLSSYAAAVEKGVPAILAEAGEVGQMQEDAVELLANGVVNVMRHLGMIEAEAESAPAKSQIPGSKSQTNSKSKAKKTARRAVAAARASATDTAASTVLTKFEWIYTKCTGVWYPKVAPGDTVKQGEQIGTVGRFVRRHARENYFASERRGVVFDHQSIRAREWIT